MEKGPRFTSRCHSASRSRRLEGVAVTDQMRDAFRALSSFVQVKMVNEPALLPRPFAVAFQEL